MVHLCFPPTLPITGRIYQSLRDIHVHILSTILLGPLPSSPSCENAASRCVLSLSNTWVTMLRRIWYWRKLMVLEMLQTYLSSHLIRSFFNSYLLAPCRLIKISSTDILLLPSHQLIFFCRRPTWSRFRYWWTCRRWRCTLPSNWCHLIYKLPRWF